MKKFLLTTVCIAVFASITGISQNTTYDSLDINNINARINNNGNLFWDLSDFSKFEVPKGSGKHSVFCAALWIGGIDSSDALHFAGERYQQQGHDYYAGPISNIYDSAYDAKWNNVWKIKKTDIDYHLANCFSTGYIPSQTLINWPCNGDVSLGQAAITAPFFDWNNNGIYEPFQGDYPLIKGDEEVYIVYNDKRNPHTESGGASLGIEVRATAYAFDCSEDSALWNTIFFKYEIINNSQQTYHDTYVGLFVDLDLGFSNDDYIGSDVERGSFYCYNGRDEDGSGQAHAYGEYPPAQSVTFLAGPYMDPDGLDNPKYDINQQQNCDESINGTNFENGIVDDERYGMNKFIYLNNSGQGAPYYSTDPDIAIDYYNYLKGYWKDSTKMIYGGNAHIGVGAYGPDCNFMFPGNSDTCNWGTGGQLPNGSTYWTEQVAGNQPDDRRGIGSMGPFTFKPGDIEVLDIAYVFGRDYTITGANAGITVMQQRIDSIIKYFRNDTTPCGVSFSALSPKIKNKQELNVYPNPASDFITIEFAEQIEKSNYEIIDISGRKINSGFINNTKYNIDISKMERGIYFINILNKQNSFSKKFIKM